MSSLRFALGCSHLSKNFCKENFQFYWLNINHSLIFFILLDRTNNWCIQSFFENLITNNLFQIDVVVFYKDKVFLTVKIGPFIISLLHHVTENVNINLFQAGNSSNFNTKCVLYQKLLAYLVANLLKVNSDQIRRPHEWISKKTKFLQISWKRINYNHETFVNCHKYSNFSGANTRLACVIVWNKF